MSKVDRFFVLFTGIGCVILSLILLYSLWENRKLRLTISEDEEFPCLELGEVIWEKKI
jgi:CHASE3 domain sensor protein